MKKISHWTPRYAFNRIKLFLWQKFNPQAPWLTSQSVDFLDKYLKDTDIGFEWGAGRSTFWFAKRVKKIISVEQDPFWREFAVALLKKNNISTAEIFLIKSKEDYAKKISEYDNKFDFILVDGLHREDCVSLALDKVKPGGLLIIDNIERYIPVKSFSPEAIRRFEDSGESKKWKQIWGILKKWRCYWTSSGVADTAIFIKHSEQ